MEVTVGKFETSPAIEAIAAALAKAQGAVKPAAKDTANTFFKSTYADLASHMAACRDALSANGIAVVQSPGFNGEVVIVTTMLAHSSGQWFRGELSARPMKADPQGIGSAITYLRRYALSAFAGTAAEDDDGNAASDTRRHGFGHAEAPPRPTRQAAPEPPPPDDMDRDYRQTMDDVPTDEPAEPAVEWFVPTPKKLAEAKAYAAQLKGRANLVKTETDFSDFLAANHDGFARLATSAKALYDEVNNHLDKVRKQAAPNALAA